MSAAPGVTAHPLSWPAALPRTPGGRRQRPKFTPPTFAQARDALLAELRRYGASGVVLSTNVELRRDGLPLAGQRQPQDPGVAVYFTRKGRPHALACDRWSTIEANLRAVADVVDAIRLIGRRGTAEMVDAVFTGFQALPPGPVPAAPGKRPWWEVLGVPAHAPTEAVRERYNRMALDHHPDRGGDQDLMARVNAAWDDFRRERGLAS